MFEDLNYAELDEWRDILLLEAAGKQQTPRFFQATLWAGSAASSNQQSLYSTALPALQFEPLTERNMDMSRQHHEIKCETEYYQDVERGIKKFELRLNDRHYLAGDMVTLVEVVNGTKTGRYLPPVEIKYVISGSLYGLKKGWCVFNW